jgi:hypothetical protein
MGFRFTHFLFNCNSLFYTIWTSYIWPKRVLYCPKFYRNWSLFMLKVVGRNCLVKLSYKHVRNYPQIVSLLVFSLCYCSHNSHWPSFSWIISVRLSKFSIFYFLRVMVYCVHIFNGFSGLSGCTLSHEYRYIIFLVLLSEKEKCYVFRTCFSESEVRISRTCLVKSELFISSVVS